VEPVGLAITWKADNVFVMLTSQFGLQGAGLGGQRPRPD